MELYYHDFVTRLLKRAAVFNLSYDPTLLEGSADIYFLIRVDRNPDSETVDIRIPQDGSQPFEDGEYYYLNRSGEVDVADGVRKHSINIQMWDAGYSPDLYDLDGSDDTEGLSLEYDLKTGLWNGDDTDGIADGREDHISGEVDGYLEYQIKTVE